MHEGNKAKEQRHKNVGRSLACSMLATKSKRMRSTGPKLLLIELEYVTLLTPHMHAICTSGMWVLKAGTAATHV